LGRLRHSEHRRKESPEEVLRTAHNGATAQRDLDLKRDCEKKNAR